MAFGPAFDYFVSSLVRRQQPGHFEIVLRCQFGFDKTRTNQTDADMAVLQVQKQRFRQIDQRRLGRPVGQAFWQAAVTGHAADQTDVPCFARQHVRQHGVQHIERADVVDLLVAQHHLQVKVGSAHVLVIASAVKHQIERAGLQNGLCRCFDGFGIAGVKRQGQRTGMGSGKFVERVFAAGRHHHARAQAVQDMRRGLANTAGGADQPDGFATPIVHQRIQGHGYKPFFVAKLIADYARKTGASG